MSAARETFPWRRMMHVGLGVLGHSSADFWRLTPRELSAALGDQQTAALSRSSLEHLMTQFPDQS